MPLTPRFALRQTPTTVEARVALKHARLTTLRVRASGPHVDVYCKPYLLRLVLPGSVLEVDEGGGDAEDADEDEEPPPPPRDPPSCAVRYDPDLDHGTLFLVLTKAVPGEHFANLDMVSNLMRRSWPQTGAVAEAGAEVRFHDERGYGLARSVVGFFDVPGYLDEHPDLLELEEGDPDALTCDERTALREACEARDFSLERALADADDEAVAEDPVWQGARAFRPLLASPSSARAPGARSARDKARAGSASRVAAPRTPAVATATAIASAPEAWTQPASSAPCEEEEATPPLATGSTATTGSPFARASPGGFSFAVGGGSESAADPAPAVFVFGQRAQPPQRADLALTRSRSDAAALTPPERDELAEVRGRFASYAPLDASPARTREAHAAVLDVVLAYDHELRTMGGELGAESPATMRKLCATMAWLDAPRSAAGALRAFGRRAVCYAYLRRWDLVRMAASDALAAYRAGRVHVVRALLATRRAFLRSPALSLHAKLVLNDACVWLQGADEAGFASFTEEFAAALDEAPPRAGGVELVARWLGLVGAPERGVGVPASAAHRDLLEELD